MPNRREFLARGAGLGVLALGAPTPTVWRRAAAAAEPKGGLPVLVVVELSGGNDGLNTVVPAADDLYHKARPTLRVELKSALRLDDRVGLHPSMVDLHRLWDKGELAVVQGVGYPNPNRSHARSMEIWQAGTPGPATLEGWLGRAWDADPSLGACHVGDEAIPLAVRGRRASTTSISRLDDIRPGPGAAFSDRSPSGDDLAREIQARMAATRDRAARLEAMIGHGPETRPDSLEGRLATVRVLLEQDPSLRVFYTSQRGFDTHASQQYAHAELLRVVSSAVAKFLADVRGRGLADRVVVLIYSEFGRRVRENAQRGTDHGAAGPVLVAGGPVRGGLFGPAPDLSSLVDGDLPFAVDFRDVYAALLRRWLGVDPAPILGRDGGTLPLV